MVGLGEPLASAVAQILKGNPKILGRSYSTGQRPHFLSCGILWWALEKPKLCTKFEVASFSHCVNIEGNPKLWGALLAQGHAHPYAYDFTMGLGKPQPPAKFVVANPSYYRNIIGEPKIFRSSPSPRPPPLFPLGVIVWWAFANPSCVPNLKSLASAVVEILKGKPRISVAPQHRATPTFLLVGFDDGPWQTEAARQVAGFTCYGNIRKSVFKRQIRFLSHPLGELGV